MEQNKIIHFFDYNKAFKHYTTIIDGMRQGYIKDSGIRKIAKPILILSLIYGIEKGLYNTNKFEYKELEHLYNEIFDKYAELAKQSEKTPLCYPFYIYRLIVFGISVIIHMEKRKHLVQHQHG